MNTSNGKRGRKPGSVSFATISLAELNARFKDPKTQIVVGSKWSEGLKLNAQAIIAGSKTPATKEVAPSIGTVTNPNTTV
jgi:hypothetical protein